MKISQRQYLYEQYKLKSEEELNAIINDDEYEEYAKEIAKEILNSDRKEYKDLQASLQEKEQIKSIKQNTRKTNPLYDDIHQIANDLRFIKNTIILGAIIMVILTIISFFI